MSSRTQTLNQDYTERFNSRPQHKQKTHSNSPSLIACADLVFFHLLFFVVGGVKFGIVISYNPMGAMRMIEWSAASATNAYFDTLKLVHFYII